MAFFTFKQPLQHQTQLHISSFQHCKYSSNFTNPFLQSLSFSHTKHALDKVISPPFEIKAAATSLSKDTAVEFSRNNTNSSSNDDEYSSRFSSSTEQRGGRKSLKEEPIRKRVILRDRLSKNGSNRKTVKNADKNRDERVSNFRNDKLVVEKKGNRNKKYDVDSPVAVLRIGLDSCSKRGDVLGAIRLYDLAKKEGINMGQYHCAVLLYLCSSAATGLVQPAKSGSGSRSLSQTEPSKEKQNLDYESLNGGEIVKKSEYLNGETLTALVRSMKKSDDSSKNRYKKGENNGIQISEEVKRIAVQKGFEIYNEMCKEKVRINEATLTSLARMAMAFGDGDMAFDMVKQMKEHGINPRLRSYGPALSTFCSNGNVEKAFLVEKHMLENNVFPEEPELEALLRVSVEAGESDRVYYVLHKLRASVRQVGPTTADLIERWFNGKVAGKIGKRKWDEKLIRKASENGGGGWHGKGWLGKGKWIVGRSIVGSDGVCESCGGKLVTIDLDPVETESFAESVADIASKREKNSSFQKFQKWLEYYGPFEAIVDGANVGLYSQRNFKPSKVNAVVNGIRQMLPSRKWPLVVLHNRRITGDKMDEPVNKSLIDKWKNADAIYATPTGSNDDWYWLYAAIKCKSLLVTNDEMRDHLFQLLGNDFFPKWKERHQVRFSFSETGPVFRMPPPCSVVIQESEKGHWHIPIISELENEDERIWLCCTRADSRSERQDSEHLQKESNISHHKKSGAGTTGARVKDRVKIKSSKHGTDLGKQEYQELCSNIKTIILPFDHHGSILPELQAAEKLAKCPIDFQI